MAALGLQGGACVARPVEAFLSDSSKNKGLPMEWDEATQNFVLNNDAHQQGPPPTDAEINEATATAEKEARYQYHPRGTGVMYSFYSRVLGGAQSAADKLRNKLNAAKEQYRWYVLKKQLLAKVNALADAIDEVSADVEVVGEGVADTDADAATVPESAEGEAQADGEQADAAAVPAVSDDHLYEPVSARAAVDRLSQIWTHSYEIFTEVTSDHTLVAAGGWVRRMDTDEADAQAAAAALESDPNNLFASGREGDSLKLQRGDGAKYLSIAHAKKLALQYFQFFKILFKML